MWSVTFSPDGKRLALGSEEGTTRRTTCTGPVNVRPLTSTRAPRLTNSVFITAAPIDACQGKRTSSAPRSVLAPIRHGPGRQNEFLGVDLYEPSRAEIDAPEP